MRALSTTIAAAALLWSIGQPGAAQAQRALDVASTFPKNMVHLGEGAENMARLLEDVSGGKLKMKVHGAGDLVPAFEVFNAVSSGAVPARSEERRVGKECVSTCRYRGSQCH